MRTYSSDKVFRFIFGTPQAYILLAVVGTLVIWSNLANGTLMSRSDFPAFYTAGRIVNEYGGERLYDKELQRKLDREVVLNRGERNDLLFVYTPFFALIFCGFALLPIKIAFFLWVVSSVVLFSRGFLTVWKAAQLPNQYRLGSLAISLTFLPFLSYCLLAGQSSAFGFFFLASAIYLEREGQKVLSGVALSLLLYKPTLLPLLLLMILVTERWRVFGGFCLGAALLGLVSLLMIGFEGIPAYLDMLSHFSEIKDAGKHPLWLDIDIYSATLMFTRDYAVWLALILAAVALPLLVLTWRRLPAEAWGLSTIWTLVLSPYVLIYDATYILIAVVLSIGWRLHIPIVLRVLLVLLYLAPWVTRQTAKTYGFSTLTVVLILYGIYEVFSLRRSKAREPLLRTVSPQPVPSLE